MNVIHLGRQSMLNKCKDVNDFMTVMDEDELLKEEKLASDKTFGAEED